MHLLSLDISTTATGYAVWNEDYTLVESGVIAPKKSGDILTRIFYIKTYVKELSKKFKTFKNVIVEDQVVRTNLKTAVWISRCQGAILSQVDEADIMFVTPSQWRKPFDCNGKNRDISKNKAMLWCDDHNYTYADDNEAEAIIIGEYFKFKNK